MIDVTYGCQKEVRRMNKVKVKINGQDYTIKGNESEAYLHQVGQEVHQMIASILERSYLMDASSAAVLAALNAVDEKKKLEDRVQRLQGEEGSRSQVKETLSQEVEELKALLEVYEKENGALEETITQLKAGETQELHQKEKEIKRLETELRLTQDSAREYRDENESLSKINKELKFELQSYKYKVLELQKKLFDTQLTQAKDRKEKNPVLREKSR